MRTILTNSVLAVALALTSVPLGVHLAAAQDVELRLDREGPRLRMREKCDPAFEDCRRDRDRDFADRDWNDRDRNRFERGCTEERALRKAARMGIRRARVVDVDRRTIDVRGRDRYDERVTVTFGRRDRSCPVL